ncbi:MAG: cytochrome c peroxidase [Gemmatimonadota bacterium]
MSDPARTFQFIVEGRWTAVMAVIGLFALFTVGACLDRGFEESASLDPELVSALSTAGVEPLGSPPAPSRELVELGRLLMFDKILSGNKNISCGTCHHPSYHSTDNLALAIGTGGLHAGATRQVLSAHLSARNTSDLYNRGLLEWNSLFWDGRVARVGATLRTPAGSALPAGVTSLLVAQAMFPVVARDEMRGYPGDTTSIGEPNELAPYPDDDWQPVWQGLTHRVLAIPAYVLLFRAAFPSVDSASLGFEHVAIALAAFESSTFTLLDSPFDRYLAGDRTALSDSAKRGALLFYGRGQCSRCHSGSLMTDQEFHNIGVPPLERPGVDSLDQGRGAVSGSSVDRFAFRTPPLRNVSVTGPWMHDGVYSTLEAAVKHYRDPSQSLQEYEPAQLDSRYRGLYHPSESDNQRILASLDPLVSRPLSLSEGDVADLVAFLRTLTDPRALNQVRIIPAQVPSGLPVFR